MGVGLPSAGATVIPARAQLCAPRTRDAGCSAAAGPLRAAGPMVHAGPPHSPARLVAAADGPGPRLQLPRLGVARRRVAQRVVRLPCDISPGSHAGSDVIARHQRHRADGGDVTKVHEHPGCRQQGAWPAGPTPAGKKGREVPGIATQVIKRKAVGMRVSDVSTPGLPDHADGVKLGSIRGQPEWNTEGEKTTWREHRQAQHVPLSAAARAHLCPIHRPPGWCRWRGRCRPAPGGPRRGWRPPWPRLRQSPA